MHKLKDKTIDDILNEIGYTQKYKVYSIVVKKIWNVKLQSFVYYWWVLTEYHTRIDVLPDKTVSCYNKLTNHTIDKDVSVMIHSTDLNVLYNINEHLYKKYNRHSVILDEDMKYFFDANNEIFKTFDHIGRDVDGNVGDVRIVSYKGTKYILKHQKSYIFHRTIEEKEIFRFNGCIKEMEMSYLLENLGITHTRQIHNIFVKREYYQRQNSYQNTFYVLMEYVSGDSVLLFDYGVTFRDHGPGRKISISAAKVFMIEVFKVFKLLLEANILPYQFNDSNIIIEYTDDYIKWRLVDYSVYELNPEKVNTNDCRCAITNFQSMFTWRLCEYTGYSNHKLSPEKHHLMWKSLKCIFTSHSDKFDNIQDESYKNGQCKGHGDWPLNSLDSLIEFTDEVQSFLTISSSL
jgi:hypothetical protein